MAGIMSPSTEAVLVVTKNPGRERAAIPSVPDTVRVSVIMHSASFLIEIQSLLIKASSLRHQIGL